MKPSLAFRLALAGLALATTVACSETAAETQPAPAEATSEVDKAVAEMFAEGRKTGEQRPDFSKETVLKLNPIVARSMQALDRFDELSPQLAAAREAKDATRIAAIEAEMGRLKADAEAAHADFATEKAALLARKEYYNEVVLAAMEQFVTEAPQEIAETLSPQR